MYKEVGELRLMRGSCFVVRCLELVTVTVLLCIWWCVLSAAGFVFFFLRTHTAYGMYQAVLPDVPLYYYTEYMDTSAVLAVPEW